MKILIDGDACCKLSVTEQIARRYKIPCHVYCDSTRNIKTKYSYVHIVSVQKDSADFAIINCCEKGDIVVTNDSGLAVMILAKNGLAINTRGYEYTNENTACFLNERYARTAEIRRTNRKQVKGRLYSEKTETEPYKRFLNNMIRKSIDNKERTCT